VRWRSKAEGTIGIELAYLDEDCRADVIEEISTRIRGASSRGCEREF
jgi:hypothetical protein